MPASRLPCCLISCLSVIQGQKMQLVWACNHGMAKKWRVSQSLQGQGLQEYIYEWFANMDNKNLFKSMLQPKNLISLLTPFSSFFRVLTLQPILFSLSLPPNLFFYLQSLLLPPTLAEKKGKWIEGYLSLALLTSFSLLFSGARLKNMLTYLAGFSRWYAKFSLASFSFGYSVVQC